MSAGEAELRTLLAHELKSPLAVIVGFAELLTKRDDEAIRTDAPARILEAAQRLQTVIDDALEVFTPQDGARKSPATGVFPTSAHGRRQGIIVVDDDALVRRLLTLTLPPEHYEVIEAANGTLAIELAREQPPALMLLDWRLPDRSGAEVLGDLNRLDLRFPVIVLTAETDRAQHELACTLGAAETLTKPFSPLHLLATVERALVSERAA